MKDLLLNEVFIIIILLNSCVSVIYIPLICGIRIGKFYFSYSHISDRWTLVRRFLFINAFFLAALVSFLYVDVYYYSYTATIFGIEVRSENVNLYIAILLFLINVIPFLGFHFSYIGLNSTKTIYFVLASLLNIFIIIICLIS